MKFLFTSLLLLSCIATLHAQDITGIWRGYFYSGNGPFKQVYKYEVQIDQLDKNTADRSALKGVTYSYHTTDFYGKARLHGIYSSATKDITLTEDTLLEEKDLSPQSFTCLMTCYLQYLKSNNTETLEGTFSSIGLQNQEDCAPGYVHLEKVTESDFHKEDFLVEKKKPVPEISFSKTNQTDAKNNSAIKRLQIALGVAPDGVAGPNTLSALKKKIPGFDESKINADEADNLIAKIKKSDAQKNGAASNPVAKNNIQENNIVIQKKDSGLQQSSVEKNSSSTTPVAKPQQITPPVPAVLKQRENNLVQSIVTSSPDIKIELYDNGEIDGDSISVYHNNELIVNDKGLTDKPITVSITADSINTHHEFVLVADNLGKIPPNTALMVLTTGNKRYEINIVSNEQRNAKIVIDYKP